MTAGPAPRLALGVRTRRPLAERWLNLRNRVLGDPRFQRWAARFPLTRFVARRRAAALFDLCAGFVYSQILYASVRLGLFDALAAGPRTTDELSARLALPAEAAQRLLDAAASLKLVERCGAAGYGLGIHGAAFVGNPAVAAMVEHHTLLYRDLADPVALLRGECGGTELRRFWRYGAAGAEPSGAEVADYSTLMARSLSLLAEDVLEAYPIERHRCLLDVGGGEGAFLEAVAARAPGLELALFDLPPVADRARARLTRAGFAARVRVVGGDVFRDPLPEGADLASLVRVVHDHDDPQALLVLRAVRRALRPGGVLLLAEPMAGTAGAEPMGDAYFGFYLLAMGQGRPRTAEQLKGLLQNAGFDHVGTCPTRRPMLTRLLVAHASGTLSVK
ncbi:MAG: acetylserotonin O-methyltransferase [Polyangiaceae bacterium]|nr:acetylserotonin O-methyltransferase [Polyangiaceae bacterium]